MLENCIAEPESGIFIFHVCTIPVVCVEPVSAAAMDCWLPGPQPRQVLVRDRQDGLFSLLSGWHGCGIVLWGWPGA